LFEILKPEDPQDYAESCSMYHNDDLYEEKVEEIVVHPEYFMLNRLHKAAVRLNENNEPLLLYMKEKQSQTESSL